MWSGEIKMHCCSQRCLPQLVVISGSVTTNVQVHRIKRSFRFGVKFSIERDGARYIFAPGVQLIKRGVRLEHSPLFFQPHPTGFELNSGRLYLVITVLYNRHNILGIGYSITRSNVVKTNIVFDPPVNLGRPMNCTHSPYQSSIGVNKTW